MSSSESSDPNGVVMNKWKNCAILGSVFGIAGSYIPFLWWYGGGKL
ncbi:MAG: hypothetical protein ACT6FD_01395 [Methanosarcinaceae archaeon]